jgi:DNA repair exonuclease SbcCD ATPase subunit
MKLLKCYVENFGKISKKEIKFHDNLTIFKEENGWGKTTLSVFIKSMLYGFDKTTKEKLERQKYTPWNNGKYGGNLDLEIKGIPYRIERFFGETPKGDKFSLTNLETNKEENIYTEKIGEEIFKLDKESFEKSIYIPQQRIEVEISNDLTTKLTNLDTIQDDMNKYEEAQNKLKKKNDELKKKIKNIEIEKKEIEEKFNKCNEAEKNLRIYEREYENLKKEQEEKTIEINKIEEKIKIENEKNLKKEIIKQYNTIKEIEEKNKREVEKIQEFFKNGIPTKEGMQEIEKQIISVEKSRQEMQENRIYQFLTEEEIQEKQNIYNDYKEKNNIIKEIETEKKHQENELENLKQNQNYKMIFIVISILILLFGIISIFFIKEKIISSIIILVGIIVWIIQKIIFSKNKKENKIMSQIEKYELQIIKNKEEKEQKRNILTEYICKYEKKYINEDIYEILLRIKLNYEAYKKSKLNIENNKPQIEKFLEKYFTIVINDYSKYLDQIKIKIENDKNIKEEYEQSKYNTQKFIEEHNMEELKNTEPIEEPIEKIKDNLQAIKEETNIIMQNLVSTEKKINEFSTIVDEKVEIETELENYEEQKIQIEKRKNIIEKTIVILEKSKEKLSTKYLQGMNLKLNNYIKLLAENSNIADKTMINIDLNTNIEIDGEKKNLEAFSIGYKDLIGICTRLALIDSIFEEEKPFLVLDDPFVNLDEEKIKNSISLIKEISNKYQIIYFSCHESRI